MIQTNRIWTIAMVMVMALLVGGGWFLGIQPFLASAASASADRAGVDAQNAAGQAALAQLAIDNKKLPELEAAYQKLQTSIPTGSDTASFITGLNGLAGGAGVQITAITVETPKAYTVPASGAVVAAPTTAAPSGKPTPTAAPVATPKSPTAPTAVTSPLITPNNFVGIQVTVGVKGGYDAVLSFVQGLQGDGRLFLVTGFTSTQSTSGGSEVDAKVTGYIYVLQPQ